MTFTRSRKPAASSASTVERMLTIVVVSSADMATTSAPCSSTAATNFSAPTSIPRSTISNPAPSSIIATRFLPTSCMSPLTVPITTLPTGSTSESTSSGLITASPAFIARAATSISGTKYSPAPYSAPTSFMAGVHGRFRSAPADSPLSSAERERAGGYEHLRHEIFARLIQSADFVHGGDERLLQDRVGRLAAVKGGAGVLFDQVAVAVQDGFVDRVEGVHVRVLLEESLSRAARI